MTVDYKWYEREQWTLIEAAQICAGVTPYQGGPATDNPHDVLAQIADSSRRALFNELYARSKDAVFQQSLERNEPPRTGLVGNTRVSPFSYVIWVIDLRMSPELEALVDKAEIGKLFGPSLPQSTDDELLETDLGYTIKGAARAVALKCPGVDETALGKTLLAAVRRGELKAIDPKTRLPYPVERHAIRDFWDRFRTVDLNRWFKDAGAGFEIGACADPDESEAEPSNDDLSPACAVFREMADLNPGEVRIEIAAGDSGGVVLNISARGARKRVTAQEFGLFDRRKAELNYQAGLLLSLAQNTKVQSSDTKTAQRMTRLRKSIRRHLGLNGDPFRPYSERQGYIPAFELADTRDAADRRAEREASRKTDTIDSPEVNARLERSQASEHQRSVGDDYSEHDAADEWLRKNGR